VGGGVRGVTNARGQRASHTPTNSISHNFIYVKLCKVTALLHAYNSDTGVCGIGYRPSDDCVLKACIGRQEENKQIVPAHFRMSGTI
jgi:hypothetical protein